MFVNRILLKDFRNYEYLDLSLNDGVNILYGDNGQGKTNLLEAVFLCSTGRSQRAVSDKELITIGCTESHVQMYVKLDEITDKIEVHLKRYGRKGIALNNFPISKLSQLFGSLLTVFFSPDELQLVKAGPAERRRFLDIGICQINKVYYHELQQYHRVLKQRNILLKKDSRAEELEPWDFQLITHGLRLIDKRGEYVRALNDRAAAIHLELTGGKETLQINYKPNASSEDFEKKLKRHLDRDRMLGSTNVGAHKDDIEFLINGRDARTFGSQGQQRTIVISVKLAEIEIMKQEKNSSPVLLLDDVFSELDESRQTFLLKKIGSLQTIITCTGVEDIIKSRKDSSVYKVTGGKIVKG